MKRFFLILGISSALCLALFLINAIPAEVIVSVDVTVDGDKLAKSLNIENERRAAQVPPLKPLTEKEYLPILIQPALTNKIAATLRPAAITADSTVVDLFRKASDAKKDAVINLLKAP